ncbi:MAG TPA: class I SAM-dependent methyltransferase [Candidatus Limnocylindrales bacterium]|nr:class I SAM-dependent methyltransferase [Candidatus Limnocylindrales bacterium]
MEQPATGSGTRWGPLFGARASIWAKTWEGPDGWGTPVYEHVLDRARIGPGTTVLDCGCGAGRFVGLAAQRGAAVAGIDASDNLAEIAAKRTPKADIRVGDFEALPWPDKTFDVVTGFSTFQFADDHVAALTEAGRVCRGQVWVVIPTRLADSGIPAVFSALATLFPPQFLSSLKRSGMYALSAPGSLEEVLSRAEMSARSDQTIESTTVFPDTGAAVGAFLSAGATALAIRHSGQPAVERALHAALAPLTGDHGQVTLLGWFRVVQTG